MIKFPALTVGSWRGYAQVRPSLEERPEGRITPVLRACAGPCPAFPHRRGVGPVDHELARFAVSQLLLALVRVVDHLPRACAARSPCASRTGSVRRCVSMAQPTILRLHA